MEHLGRSHHVSTDRQINDAPVDTDQSATVQVGNTTRTVKPLSSSRSPLEEIRAGLVRLGEMISSAATEVAAFAKRVVRYAAPMEKLKADLAPCIGKPGSTVNTTVIKQVAIDAARHVGRPTRSSALGENNAVKDFYEDLGKHLRTADKGARALFLKQTYQEFNQLGVRHLQSIANAATGLQLGLGEEFAPTSLNTYDHLDRSFADALKMELRLRDSKQSMFPASRTVD